MEPFFTACIIAKYPTQVADWLINPMCRGIFAGNSKLLSLKSCFPLLYGYEQNHGSIIKGMLRGSDGKKDSPSSEHFLLLLQRNAKQMIMNWL